MSLALQTWLIIVYHRHKKKSEASFFILFLSVAFDCQYDDKVELDLTLTVY